MKRINVMINTDLYREYHALCNRAGHPPHTMLRCFALLVLHDSQYWISKIAPFCSTKDGVRKEIRHFSLNEDIYKELLTALIENQLSVSAFFRGCICYYLSAPDSTIPELNECIEVLNVPEVEPKATKEQYASTSRPQVRVSKEMIDALHSYCEQHELKYHALLMLYVKAVNRDPAVLNRFNSTLKEAEFNKRLLIPCKEMNEWQTFKNAVAKQGMFASIAIRRFLATIVMNPDFDYHDLE